MKHRWLVGMVGLALLVAPAALAGHGGTHNPSSQGNVASKAPQAQAPDASADDDDGGTAGVQVTPNSGTARTVDITVDADDDNGHNDFSSAKVTVYKPDGTTVHNSIQNEAATKSNGNGKTATYSHSFDMNYYDDPGTYTIEVTVTDRDGRTDTSTTTFEYESLAALSTDTSTISFDDGSGGSLDPKTNTHGQPENVSIENTGNVQMDLSFSGTDLSDGSGNTIAVNNTHVDTDQDNDFSTNEWQLSTTTQTDTTFDLSASTDGTASTKYALFAIHTPSPLPAGTYTGSVTLEAVSG